MLRRPPHHGAGKRPHRVTELLVGVPFPALAFEIVRFAVPARYLTEFTFGAATYDTDAALQRGWVDTVVPAETLMGEAMAAAQQLARLSPAAFAQAKKQLRQHVSESIARSGSATDKTVTDIWAAPELARLHPRLRRADAEESLVRTLRCATPAKT